MQADQHLCHRCSAVLADESLFCPHCGSPQLVLSESEAERVAAERSAAPAMEAAAAQLPRFTAMQRIRWRPVLQIAAVLTLLAAATSALSGLAPAFGLVGWFFVFASPMLTLNLYRRRVPGAPMGAAVGARIGVALGVMLAFVLVAENAVSELIYRYVLHKGAVMDAEITAAIQRMNDTMAARAGMTGSAPELARVQQFFASADGHAAMALAGGMMLAGLVLLYSAFSGMLLGWLRPMPPRRSAA